MDKKILRLGSIIVRKKIAILAVVTLVAIANLTIAGSSACLSAIGGSSQSSINKELPEDFGCTLGGCTGSIVADNDIFFGQTMDNPWWPTRHTLFVIQPENGYKYIGTKAYIWGFWTGINEKGFGWAGAYVGCTDTPNPAGINRFEIGPMLLSSCANVKEAIELLKKVPRSKDFPPRNAIMGDAEGNLALVEISYTKANVETLTKDGYVVRTNHFISDKMKGVDKKPDPYHCSRFERGTEWFKEIRRHTKIHIEDMFQYWSYVYLTRLNDTTSGPGTCCVIQPKKLIYWFTYGWPSGNLPPKELENRQICQNMTWGVFIPFYLPELPPGQYTTELGQLTPLAIQYLYAHFSSDLQRSPAWFKYQSVDPMKTFYKPAEDIASPDGYAPKENPYGPGGYSGTWTKEEGYKPLKQKKKQK
ncbi:linear amide C-N hydrolase [Candidatus Aerophobetes bacterium]|nr:linear amide C-N hydrolase [Candidatus Aerophobetes bacterium]